MHVQFATRQAAQTHPLRRFPALDDLPHGELVVLACGGTQITLPAGRVVWHAGGLGRETLLVLDGEVRVDLDKQDVIVGAGHVVGEMAVLSRGRRTATVTTRSLVEGLVFTPSELCSVLRSAPTFAGRVIAAYSLRLRGPGSDIASA